MVMMIKKTLCIPLGIPLGIPANNLDGKLNIYKYKDCIYSES